MSKLLQSSNFYRMIRNSNISHTGDISLYERSTKLDNNIKILEDPTNNRKLTLIGTMNSSDLLANRTKKILENLEYSSLLVQSTPQWFEHIQNQKFSVKVFILLFKLILVSLRY
jgi:hypothetical protein